MKVSFNNLLRNVTGLGICLCLCLVLLPRACAAENTTDFFGGDGSAENPYLVGTKEHLDHVRDYPDAHFLVVADLTFTASDFEETGNYYNNGVKWVPIGTAEAPFTGVFSGGGHTISGLSISISTPVDDYNGLFGYSTGTITQLSVTGVNYSVQTPYKIYVGGIVGYNSGTICDCSCSGEIYVSVPSTATRTYPAYAGGIAGYNVGGMIDCSNTATVYAPYVGGITGRSTGPIQDCSNSGVIGSRSSDVVGGIVGYSTAEIKNCSNAGKINKPGEDYGEKEDYSYVGGIAGYATGKVSECKNLASVTGAACGMEVEAYVGGIVGYAGGEISACTNRGQVHGSAYRSRTYNKVYDTVHVGGIAGYNKKSITNCAQLGAVSAAARNCSASYPNDWFEAVYSTAYMGGIVGTNAGKVSGSYSTGETVSYSYKDKISAAASSFFNGTTYAGGLAGQSSGSMTDCYFTGIVCGRNNTKNLGGIVGKSSGTIQTCYSLGAVTGWMHYGTQAGVAGSATGKVSSVYYLNWTGAEADTAAIGVALEREDMSNQAMFAGFDFVSVWRMDPVLGVPTLISNPHISSWRSAIGFAGGSGTLFDPYLIKTTAHLDNVRDYPHSYFKLASSISFNSTSWEPFSFLGVLDGSGYSISGLKQTLTATNGGMIDVNGGVVRNLTLRSATITHTGNETNAYVGALVGENRGVITDCAVDAASKVSCTLTGDYKGYAGGIVGWNNGFVTGCSNAGNVFFGNKYQVDTYAGGIVALNDKTVADCSNSGKVEARYCAGGIVAWNEENATAIQYCSNSGTVVTTEKTSYIYGDPNASYAGGIVGYNCGSTEYCFNTGAVTSNGFNSGSTYDSANPYAGGIAGSGNYVSNSYNTGSITAKEGYNTYAGGIAGKSLSVSCCYNVGSLTATSCQTKNYSGAIVGTGSVYSNCYYLNTAYDGTGSGSDYATICSAEMMRKQSTFSSFDFYGVWMIDSFRSYGYPILQDNCAYTVSSLVITKAPAEPLQTVEGIVPKIEGCTVRITYDDGYTVTTEATSDMIPALCYACPGNRTTPLEYCGVSSRETIPICVAEKTLQELLILASPDKTVYMEGEELETEGLYVVAVYNNKTEHKVIPESFSGYDSSVGTKTIVISYMGLTTTFTVEVCACKSIKVTTMPDKLTYVQGQTLSADGGVITVTLTNGSTRTFQLSQAQLTYPTDKVNTVKVTVTLFDRTTYYFITVNPRVAEQLNLISVPDKTVYYVGEELDPTGGVLRVVFESEDSYTEEIPLTKEMLSEFDNTQAGYPTVTVSYCGGSTTFLIRVRDYGVAAVHDGMQITVTVGVIPDNSIVLVAQYDSSGKQISCGMTAVTATMALDPAACTVYAYLADADSFVPYIRPIEVVQSA